MSQNLSSCPYSSEYYVMLQRLLKKTSNPKLGLERMRKLLELCGFDRTRFLIVQVVGTNGKGSTSAFIESILRQCGQKTGLFTSPHLSCARERIRIKGQMISESEFVRAGQAVLRSAEQMEDEPSFFECMLALAIWAFSERRVEVMVLEAGLGGRLDATTATDADVLGICTIDYDHQNILGSTLQEIAWEKACAARANEVVITYEQHKEVEETFKKAQSQIGFKLKKASACEHPTSLYGSHQLSNAALAIAIVKELLPDISDVEVARGLMSTSWPGRFEIIQRPAPVVLDCAHNPSGMESLVACLKNNATFMNQPIILVYGSLKGINAEKKLQILMNSDLLIDRVFIHRSRNPRALSFNQLRSLFVGVGFAEDRIANYGSMPEITDLAQATGALVVVSGSIYTVGEIRSALLDIPADHLSPSF